MSSYVKKLSQLLGYNPADFNRWLRMRHREDEIEGFMQTIFEYDYLYSGISSNYKGPISLKMTKAVLDNTYLERDLSYPDYPQWISGIMAVGPIMDLIEIDEAYSYEVVFLSLVFLVNQRRNFELVCKGFTYRIQYHERMVPLMRGWVNQELSRWSGIVPTVAYALGRDGGLRVTVEASKDMRYLGGRLVIDAVVNSNGQVFAEEDNIITLLNRNSPSAISNSRY